MTENIDVFRDIIDSAIRSQNGTDKWQLYEQLKAEAYNYSSSLQEFEAMKNEIVKRLEL